MPRRLAQWCAVMTTATLLAACDPRTPKPSVATPTPPPSPSATSLPPLPPEYLEACGLPPGSTVVPSSCPGVLGPDNVSVPG
ncbi:hypothetical protein J3R03_008197 [Actinoplanes couchii]|uniref:hypothetical protein n=1 Tax=Actinoplanes couchii TaxID=403638 RepID=UPI00194271DA|nr:hypothetical protein [Actinoplanes couchii]MDR6324001.1 hypothetical protein [Actinoplanes couchii]